jgi:ornithine carbamoyltransferase
VKGFLDLADLSREEVVDLLELALRLERHPESEALKGKIPGRGRGSWKPAMEW